MQDCRGSEVFKEAKRETNYRPTESHLSTPSGEREGHPKGSVFVFLMNPINQLLWHICVFSWSYMSCVFLQTVTHNAYDKDPYAQEFGIKISQTLASVEARILPPPWV